MQTCVVLYNLNSETIFELFTIVSMFIHKKVFAIQFIIELILHIT